MGRSLTFIGSLILGVTVLVLAVTWWVGPKLAYLAFLDAQRDQPYMVLDLSSFAAADTEDADTRYSARYVSPLRALVASEAGTVSPEYALSQLVVGQRKDAWPRLQRIRMSRAQDLVQVLTSSPYRSMIRANEGIRSLKLGSYQAPDAVWKDAVVVWLATNRLEQSGSPFERAEALLGNSGRVVWHASVEAMVGEEAWNYALAIEFDSAVLAKEWLRRADVEMARIQINSRVRELAVAVYEID